MLVGQTHEIQKDENVKLWVSTGPKSYHFKDNLGMSKTKLKGLHWIIKIWGH